MLVRLDDEPDVVAVIPTLGTDLTRLKACIEATITQRTPRRLAVLCIVNSPEPLREDLGVAPEVAFVTAGLNLGFAGALQFGRSLTASPYRWIVQDDMQAAPDCLERLFEVLDARPRCGLATPIAVDADGLVPTHSCGGKVLADGATENWYPPTPTPPDQLEDLDELNVVAGRGALVRSEAWDAVGGFDPRFYPVMFADIDFCHALGQAGYEVTIVTEARVAHPMGGSTTRAYAAFLRGRNAQLFATKWFPSARAPTSPFRAPSRRPVPPGALTGALHPGIEPGLLANIAQAAADTLGHVARNFGAMSASSEGVIDAIVIGAGPNGLAAAVAIAEAGFRVAVYEGHDTIGGGTRTEELLMPGVLHDVCSAVHPFGAASPFFQSLDLDAHGLAWARADIDLAHPLDGGRAGVLQGSLDATADGFGTDGAAWRKTYAPLVDSYGDVIREFFQPVAHVPRHPFTLARFGLPMLLPATRFAHRFTQDETRGLIAGIAAHAFQPLTRPTTAAAALMFVGAAHTTGWPVAVGGSQAITAALASKLRSLGGTIETGVVVRSLSDLPPHRVALLDVTPIAAIAIAGERMPDRVRQAFGRWAFGPAAFKVDFVVEGGVPWSNEACSRAGTVHCGGTLEEIAAAEKATYEGQLPERPYVLVGQQYLADSSRSHGNLHPIWAYAHVPNGYPDDLSDVVLDQIERFAPGLRERIVAIASISPREFEAYNPNYVGGDIASGDNGPRQLLFRPRPAMDPYRIADDLFLCSQATPPGPGVHGMCGYNAARSALKFLRSQRR